MPTPADKKWFELMVEAEERGLLNENQSALLEEARNRRLLDGGLSYGQALSSYGSQLTAGVNRGLGMMVDVANLPFQAVEGLTGLNVASDRPIGGSRFMEETFNQDVPEAESGVERGIGRLGEELGATVVPAAAIARAARGVPAATRELTGLGRRVWESFLDPIRRTPGRAAVGETVAATGAGIGAGVAQEYSDSAGAEGAGQLIGGLVPVAGALLPTSLAYRAAMNIARRVSPTARAKTGRRTVHKLLGEELTGDADQAVSESMRLRREIPGFDPTLGEATGSPALLAQQRALESQASGSQLERFRQRQEASSQAIDTEVARRAPGSEVPPEIIVDVAQGRVTDLRLGVSRAQEQALNRRTALSDRLPFAAREDAGSSLREAIQNERIAASDRMSRLAIQLGINDADVSVPFGRARQQILDEFTARSFFEDAASRPEVLRTIELAGKRNVTFADLKALRERVSDDLRDSLGAANPRNRKIRALVTLKGHVDGIISDLTQQADPELAKKYKQFRQAYFDEFVQPFDEGAVFRVRQRDGRGFYRIPDERVAQSFFAPGKISAARQFNRVLGTDPKAVASLEAVALDSLRSAAVRDGVIDPQKYQTWLRQHQGVLREFPALRQTVDSAGNANEALVARQVKLAERALYIEDQRLVRILDRARTGDQTPTQVLDQALANPQRFRSLVRSVRPDREAMDGLRRYVWDKSLQGNAGDSLQFLAQNAESVRQVFSDRHFADMATVLAARSMAERSPVAAGRASVARPFDQIESMIGQGIPQMGSRIFAFKSGRMQKGYLVLDTVLRGLRGRAAQAANEVFSEALYDPEVARLMANQVMLRTPREHTARRLRARFFALGLPYLTEAQEK